MDWVSIIALALLWTGVLVWTLIDGKIVGFGGSTDRRHNPKRYWFMFGGLIFMTGLFAIAIFQPNFR